MLGQGQGQHGLVKGSWSCGHFSLVLKSSRNHGSVSGGGLTWTLSRPAVAAELMSLGCGLSLGGATQQGPGDAVAWRDAGLCQDRRAATV